MLKGCAKVCGRRACQARFFVVFWCYIEEGMKILRPSGDFRRVLFSKPHSDAHKIVNQVYKESKEWKARTMKSRIESTTSKP
jgi:hypothetical protein